MSPPASCTSTDPMGSVSHQSTDDSWLGDITSKAVIVAKNVEQNAEQDLLPAADAATWFKSQPMGGSLSVLSLIGGILPKQLSMTEDEILTFLKARFRMNDEWAQRLAAHSFSGTPTNLTPDVCPGEENWIRHDMPIDGFPYRAAVFLPKGDRHPKTFYRRFFEAGFEVLKASLAPDDLAKLFRPGKDVPDLSLYARSWSTTDAKIFQDCGVTIDEIGGRYVSATNRIFLVPEGRVLSDIIHITGENYVTDTLFSPLLLALYHEVAHAIHDRLILPATSQNLRVFYIWTVMKVIPDLKEATAVMKAMLSGDKDKTQSLIKQAKKIKDYENYLPNGTLYSLVNPGEFFAELVGEYFVYKTIDLLFPLKVPKTPAYQARLKIMKDFFAPQGIKQEAFSLDQIEKAHKSHGIKMDLGVVVKPLRTGLALPISVGWNYASLDTDEGSVRTNGLRVGFRAGFRSKNMFAKQAVAFGVTADLTKYSQDAIALSYGLWGEVDHPTKLGTVSLIPALGLRNLWQNDQHALTAWLGGRIGLGWGGTFGLEARARIHSNLSYEVGLGLSFDLPSFRRE